MENKINSIVKKFRSDRIRRRRFTALMTVLSMVVSSSVFWQLRSTGNALTDDYLCGMTEHVHSAECFSEELICTEDHEHTDECTVIVMNCDETVHTHSMQCMSDISADVESAEDWEKTLPDTLTDNFSENLIAVASSQLGYSESVRNFVLDSDSVRRGYTRYGQWYGSRYGEWNTMFTYFCLYYAGITEKIMPYGSGCWAWTETLSEAGLLTAPDSGEIKVGDLVFFDTNADDRPDRSGIVSAISKPDDEEDSPQTITVIEGDLDDKVDTAEYSIEDEKLVGFVSIDKLAESDMDFLTSSPEDEELSESDMELPMLPFGDSEIAAYANNGTPDIMVNGAANYTTPDTPLVVTAGDTITIEITLHRDKDQYPTAYFEEVYDQTVYKNTPSYQRFDYDDNGTMHYHTTLANVWTNGGFTNAELKYEAVDQNTVLLKKVYTADTLQNGQSSKDYIITYNGCQPEENYSAVEDLYVRVNNSSTPDPQPTGSKIHMIKPTRQDTNEHLTAATAFSVQPGDSVTLVGTVDKNKYTVYPNANEYNNAKAANTDPELQFVRVGNKYISTYARFWGLDNGGNGSSNRFSGRVERYDFDNDGNLNVFVTYTAKEIGITTENKYVVTFADEQGYGSFEQFWLTNDATMIYVYSTVGWRDIDRVNEAMDGVGGDSGNGKYWKNGKSAGDGYPGNFGAGQFYVVHPGDWIYLAGEGNGHFEGLGPWDDTKAVTADGNAIIVTYGAKPTATSSKQNTVMLQMPGTVSGSTFYKIDYVMDDGSGASRSFYFKLSDESTWNNKIYDHADIEIADGGVYQMVSEHWVKPDGTEIKTVRVYGASITKVFRCDVKSDNSTLITIPGGEYSSQGSPGDTQYELTSKYKTDGNGNRVDKNGNIIEDGNGELVMGVREFKQTDVKGADFYVNVHLIPESEITTITYPDGSTEEIINADFDASNPIDVEYVKLEMDHQSVIDAVNKCPDHSGLDFTILDETLTSKLRSGSVLIEAYKRFKDEQGNVYDLVGGEFEFELYEYDPTTNTETLVSSSTNVTEGYVYFDNQFYIDLDMSDDDPKEFYYRIKEKIPEQRDDDITYSVRVENVKVTVTPTETSDGIPTYETKVEYLNMNDDPEYKHTYTPKDKDHNPTGEADRTIPAFVNIKKTYAYTLPNTGGSGTTMFFILGPMLMLGSAVIAIRRKRKERV